MPNEAVQKPQRKHVRPPWFAHVRDGDVLRWPSGDFRVVRKVSRHADGRLFCLSFAIRRRSWTNRPYTVYHANDLLQIGPTYVGARLKLTGEMDERIRQAWGERNWPNLFLTAADVAGVP